jgi:ABC-type amino acid transport substrate-binding protein
MAVARKGVTLKTYDDLKPLKTAIVKGANFGTAYDKDTGLNKSEEPNIEQILRKMQAGRIDVGVGTAPSLRVSAKLFDLADMLGDSLMLNETQMTLFAARDKASADTQAKLKTALAAMRSDGSIDKIIDVYVTKDWAPR